MADDQLNGEDQEELDVGPPGPLAFAPGHTLVHTPAVVRPTGERDDDTRSVVSNNSQQLIAEAEAQRDAAESQREAAVAEREAEFQIRVMRALSGLFSY